MKDFEPSDYWDANVAKRQDRYSHLAMAAAKMALKDGGCDPKASDRTALPLSTGRPPPAGGTPPPPSSLRAPLRGGPTFVSRSSSQYGCGQDLDSKRFGVLVGSGVGGLDAVERSCDILFNKARLDLLDTCCTPPRTCYTLPRPSSARRSRPALSPHTSPDIFQTLRRGAQSRRQ